MSGTLPITFNSTANSASKAILEGTKNKQHKIVLLLLKPIKFLGRQVNHPVKLFYVFQRHGLAGLRKYSNARSAKDRRIYLESKLPAFEAKYKKEYEKDPEKAKIMGEKLQSYRNTIRQLLEDEKYLNELLL